MAATHLRFVPVSTLSDNAIARMDDIRFHALPSLVGRSEADDLIRFRRILRDYHYVGLVLDEHEEIEGFLLFALLVREFAGRHFLWAHLEDAAIEPAFRGKHLTEKIAIRILANARLHHPIMPMYMLSLLFPPTYIEARTHGETHVWGDPRNPSWEAGLLDYMAEQVAGDHPIDRQRHTVQLYVTSGSDAPPKFRFPRHRAWFEEYERAAPRWREGHVPVVLCRISILNILRAGMRQMMYRWMKTPRFTSRTPHP